MKFIVLADDDNPQDMSNLQKMLKVDEWVAVVEELDQELRRLIKYGDKSAEVQKELEALRRALYESLSDRQLDIYSDQ